MYLSHPLEKVWASDIEGNDLLPGVTQVWCFCATNLGDKREVRLRDYGEISAWVIEQTLGGCVFVFHNGIGYDAPVLNMLVGTRLSPKNVIDTMLLSMIYCPSGNIAGVQGHSLEDWGIRLRFPKGHWDDFSQWSQAQEDYCMNDARLCGRIYMALRDRMLAIGFTEDGLDIEHRAWAFIQVQKRNGVAFNYEGANVLLAKVREKERSLADDIHRIWPPVLTRVFTGSKSRKANGEETANYRRHLELYDDVRELPDGRYDCYQFVSFNIGSPSQRVQRLLELGWEPEEFTKPSNSHPNGQPKPVTKGRLSPSLERFVEQSGIEGAGLIAKWIDFNARGNMINTWMEAYNHDTGCIHGQLWLANTLRYRHSNPNTANIPAVRVCDKELPIKGEEGVYTYEARDLFRTRDPRSRRLVGVDAKGIQLRVLAHYLNNEEFTDAVISGDPHSYNQKVGGFGTRAVAKTFLYAFLLGAGDAKIGQITGGSSKDGRVLKRRFVGNFPGLSDLLDDLERQVERTGRIILCDGTPLAVTAPHTRLGYLLQGDESRIMKKAAILIMTEVARQKLDVLKVLDVHDEFQFDVRKEDVDAFVRICTSCFDLAGKHFSYRVPIECSVQVGETWAMTH